MLKCIIVDDEPLAIKLLSDYVNKAEGLALSDSFTDPIKALQYAETNRPDLIFLDIQMPELTGIQFMKITQGKYNIILTTAYEDYALDSYEFDVIDYLLKPISLDRFLIAIDKFKNRISGPSNSDGSSNTPPKDYIFVKSEYKTLKIQLSDIRYLEGLGDYIAIHLPDKKILTLEKMKHFESTLPAHNFMRIHKSYLIALDKIEYIEKNRVVIGDKRLPVGATYKERFWEKIGGG